MAKKQKLEDDDRGELAEAATDGPDEEDTLEHQTIGEGENAVKLPYDHPRAKHQRRMDAAKEADEG